MRARIMVIIKKGYAIIDNNIGIIIELLVLNFVIHEQLPRDFEVQLYDRVSSIAD